MADSNTTTYSFTLPEVGASADSWGTKLNANWDKVDDLLDGSIAVNGITVTGGSIDGTPVGATTPSTGEFTSVDVTGTVTADGLTVDTGGTPVILNHSATGPTLRFNNLDQTVADGQQLARIEFSTDDGGSTTDEAYLQLTATGGGGAADFDIMVGDGTPVKRARFGVGGDVSFYEDTGTTAKFVWDASAEKLSVSSQIELSNVDGKIAWANGFISGGNSYGDMRHFGDRHRFYSEDGSKLAINIDIANNKTEFYTSGSERMRIDSSGNVGIGTASPSAPLEIGSPNSSIFLSSAATTVGGQYLYDQNYFDIGALKSSGAPYIGYGVRTSLTTGNTFVSDTSVGVGRAALAVGSGGNGTITFSTGAGETTASGDPLVNMTERARIDSSGGVRVNTTAVVFSQYEKLSVLGSGSNHAGIGVKFGDSSGHGIGIWNTSATGAMAKFAVGSSGTSIGSITHNSSSVAYNTTSDERLKENIQDTTHTVDINDIQVREFDWKVDGSHQRYGFIAQELEAVYPEAVHSPDEADEMKSVDYSKLVPLLVKEIQTLKARIETLENN